MTAAAVSLCSKCRAHFFGLACSCSVPPPATRFILGGTILDAMIVGAIAEIIVNSNDTGLDAFSVTAPQILAKVRARGARVVLATVEARLAELVRDGRVEVQR